MVSQSRCIVLRCFDAVGLSSVSAETRAVAQVLQLPRSVETDELLTEAYAELRCYSSTPNDAKANESYNRLMRYYLPAIGAECPAYGKALGGTLQWLADRRTANQAVTSQTPLSPI
jgi:hypothetical protein